MRGLEHLRKFERLRRRDAEQADATTLALRLYDHLVATGHAHDVIERTLFKWIAQQGLSGAQAHAIAQRAHIHLVAPQASGRPVVNLRARAGLESDASPAMPPARPWRPIERFHALHALAGRTRSEIAFSEVRHLEVMREAMPDLAPRSPYRPPAFEGVRAPMPGVYALQMSPRSEADAARARAMDLEPGSVLAALGAGRPLPLAMRAELAPRLATLGVALDLSEIRIHDDTHAAKVCAELGAEAFAVGDHVVFGRAVGHARADLALLAHELTHVWQQARGVVAPGVEGSAALESEARAVERAVLGSGPDQDPGRARETSRLVHSFSRELGLDPSRVEVHANDAAREETTDRGLLGLMREGKVYLDPDRYNPGAPDGRALLAHELVHVAQREQQRRGANTMSDSAQAEREAHELAGQAAMGQALTPPTVGLPGHVEAACGPQAMAERETPPGRNPRRETEPEPEPSPTIQTVRVPPVYRIEQNQIVIPTIHYRVDKDEITETTPDARPIMKQLAETLKTYPEITKIRIEGFTSTTGTEEHNRSLSQRRADKTRAWLLGKEKVAGVAMDTKGWGEATDRLKIKTADEVEEEANRRTEVTVVEVDGRPAPANWQPTRMRLVASGQTIIRHLDAEGRVVREEVIPDGAAAEPGGEAAGDGATAREASAAT